MENLWHYLRSHHLSNRAYRDYDDLLDAGGAAWRALTPEVIKSVCRTSSARSKTNPYDIVQRLRPCGAVEQAMATNCASCFPSSLRY